MNNKLNPESIIRKCYLTGGYVFAKKPDINGKVAFQEYARLASNENPRPPSDAVVKAVCEAVNKSNRYPDEESKLLFSALKETYGDSYTYAVSGTGMDGIIETVIRVVVGPLEKVIISSPTFSYYSIATTTQGGVPINIQRREDFSVDPESIITASKDAKLVIICSPNNPTGNSTPIPVIEDILSNISCPLFLDNAYIEFSNINYLPLLSRYDNLIIGRTFSKAYSLAGLRIGYAFLPEWLLTYYKRAMTPFNLSVTAEAAAVAALKEREHIKEAVTYTARWRDIIIEKCRYPAFPSDTNFIMIDTHPRSGDAVTDILREHGVIVRSCRSFPGLPDHYIRVSIGEDWEMERFIGAINSI